MARGKFIMLTVMFSLIALYGIVRYMWPEMTSGKLLNQGYYKAKEPPFSGPYDRTAYQDLYGAIPRCTLRKSNATCTFPLLLEYTQKCRHFPRLTFWKNVSRENPSKTTLSSRVCSLPPISSANQKLREYIKQRNITSIAVFGDSNGKRSTNEFVRRLRSAFKCTTVKEEPGGFKTHLDYYTAFSGTNFAVRVNRTCQSCTSALVSCSDKSGKVLSVEYISMTMGVRHTIHVQDHPVCKSAHPHLLCFNMSQQEYVFKHYLNRPGHTYPQLILYIGSLAHDTDVPLDQAYDGLLYLDGLFRAHVPPTTHVICYSYSIWDERKASDGDWHSAVEGPGFNINEKLRAENHFLAKMLANHKKAGYRPLLFPFLDLYHMKWQLRGAWATDAVHSIPAWYENVIGFTATLLQSLPLPEPQSDNSIGL